MAYITYPEYQSLGGTVDEAAFNNSIQIVEAKLNYITNGRIQLLDDIPEEVKTLCVRLVEVCAFSNVDRDQSLTSYSNGIETFGYSSGNNKAGSTSIDEKLAAIIQEWLWKYPQLLYRGRKQWKQRQ